MEQKKIETLYRLLEKAEKTQDYEAAAALRWAIFNLEQEQKGHGKTKEKRRQETKASGQLQPDIN